MRGETITVGAAVLQLLPARLRAAAAGADGDRAARRLAARVVTRARHEPRRARRSFALACGRRAARAGRRLEPARPRRRTRSARSCSRRSRSSSSAARGPAGARRVELAGGVLVARRPQPPPLRRLHRPRRDRAARARRSSAARTARRKSQKLEPGQTMRSAATPTLPRLDRAHGRTAPSSAPSSPSRAAEAASAPPRRQEQLPGRGQRSRTRSGSAPTGCGAGPVRDRRPVQRRRLGRAQGAREPARRLQGLHPLRLPQGQGHDIGLLRRLRAGLAAADQRRRSAGRRRGYGLQAGHDRTQRRHHCRSPTPATRSTPTWPTRSPATPRATTSPPSAPSGTRC